MVLLIIWLKMQANCNFYVLPDARENGRFLFCCALIEKLNAHGHCVYVHCQNQEEALHFNDLLWTYKDISFIPHSLSGEHSADDAPVQIGFDEPPAGFKDVLIFLSVASDIPDFCMGFERVVEIVNQEPFIKDSLRAKYQVYRSKKYVIKSHTL